LLLNHGNTSYLEKIINELNDYDAIIKIIPDMYDILSGQVKMNSISDTALIVINKQVMPNWQQSVKRFIDVSAICICHHYF
jgi:hypothetical protein